MKILYLANLIPFPQDGGGKIFTYSTLEALSRNNVIDLLCFYEHEDIQAAKIDLAQYCNFIAALPIRVTTKENMSLMMKKAVRSLISSKPLAVSKYYKHEMQDIILNRLTNNKYDCVFMNLLAMGLYAERIREYAPNIRIVLYEQNCEAIIYKRLFVQEKNLLKKLFIGYEYIKLHNFEQKILKTVNNVIVLSEEDKKNLGVKNAAIIPIGVPPQSYQKVYADASSATVKMLFVGTMTWAPNNEGIVWFLKNVMPLCEANEFYSLTIVGKNPSEEVCMLAKQFPNVHVKGYVENIEDEYNSADVLIVPLFVGSGQRVKIIEAFSRGFAVISTSIGAEGLAYIDQENMLIADSAEKFKVAIDKCRDKAFLRKIGQGGKYVYEATYSTDVISTKLNQIIQEKAQLD